MQIIFIFLKKKKKREKERKSGFYKSFLDSLKEIYFEYFKAQFIYKKEKKEKKKLSLLKFLSTLRLQGPMMIWIVYFKSKSNGPKQRLKNSAELLLKWQDHSAIGPIWLMMHLFIVIWFNHHDSLIKCNFIDARCFCTSKARNYKSHTLIWS